MLHILVTLATACYAPNCFTSFPAHAAEADVVCVAQVLEDKPVLVDAMMGAGNHRVVILKPLLALKGALPEKPVAAEHSHDEKREDVLGKVYWTSQHTVEHFKADGIFFVALYKDGKGGYQFRGVVESCIRHDDPKGEARKELRTAFDRAKLKLPDTWEQQLAEHLKAKPKFSHRRFWMNVRFCVFCCSTLDCIFIDAYRSNADSE